MSDEKRDYNLRELLQAIIGQRLVDVTQEEVEELEDVEQPAISLMFENGWVLTFDIYDGFHIDTPKQGEELSE